MPFPFVYICDLLDKLEGIHVREVAYLPKDRKSRTKDALMSWFQTHRWRINANDTDGNAVLMMLKPERQTDRDYGLEEYMEQILARIFKMPTAMYEKLKLWRDEAHNHGDLALRLCQVLQEMKVSPPLSTASMTFAEEIDQALLRIAIFNTGSSVAVKSLKDHDEKPPDRLEVLEELYLRLQPREAKWLTRIILKNHGPVTLPAGFPVPGNVTNLPNSLPVMLNFPIEPPTPRRRMRTRIKRGVGSNNPTQPLPTPPTSSPLLPNPEVAAEKPPPRIRIGWNHQSSTLLATVKVAVPQFPPRSSPLPKSSALKSIEVAPKLASPPTFSMPAALVPSSSIPTRKALGQISSNVPSGGSQSQHTQPQSQDNGLTVYARISSSSHVSQAKSLPHLTTYPPVMFSPRPHHLTPSSPFTSSLLILCPMLLTNTFLLTTLIPYHSAHYIPVLSLATLLHPSIPRRTASGHRVKKFILVDITRPEKAVGFCQQAEKLVREVGWKRRGRLERIPIFDWRVLEGHRRADVDGGVGIGEDLVGKHFQGTI